MTVEEIISTALVESWSNKQAKKAAFSAGLGEEGQMAVVAGLRAAGRTKGPESAPAATITGPTLKDLKEQAAARAEAKEREAREAAAAKLADERAAMEGVEPHWPTYRRAMSLASTWREACDAMRFRDMGDVIAFRPAGEALLDLAEEVCLPQASVAFDILRKTVIGGRPLSEAQAKLVAISLAKHASVA